MNIELEKCSGTEISLTQCLFLRTLFEELTRNYNMPDGSDIDTIKWFIKNGIHHINHIHSFVYHILL